MGDNNSPSIHSASSQVTSFVSMWHVAGGGSSEAVNFVRKGIFELHVDLD